MLNNEYAFQVAVNLDLDRQMNKIQFMHIVRVNYIRNIYKVDQDANITSTSKDNYIFIRSQPDSEFIKLIRGNPNKRLTCALKLMISWVKLSFARLESSAMSSKD